MVRRCPKDRRRKAATDKIRTGSSQDGAGRLQVMEVVTPQELNIVEEPDYIDINVTLDSGAAEHVADASDAPGYVVNPSPGSKAGQGWRTANGEIIPNKGEMILELEHENSKMSSKFQVGSVSRPLWSVGKLCDAGYKVVFDKDDATVIHKASNAPVTTFKRRNALYECDMRLRNPRAMTATPVQEPAKGFRRQERG